VLEHVGERDVGGVAERAVDLDRPVDDAVQGVGDEALDGGAGWVLARGVRLVGLSAPLRSRLGCMCRGSDVCVAARMHVSWLGCTCRSSDAQVAARIHIEADNRLRRRRFCFRLTTRREKGGLTNIELQAK
jgi:hypothetical protein